MSDWNDYNQPLGNIPLNCCRCVSLSGGDGYDFDDQAAGSLFSEYTVGDTDAEYDALCASLKGAADADVAAQMAVLAAADTVNQPGGHSQVRELNGGSEGGGGGPTGRRIAYGQSAMVRSRITPQNLPLFAAVEYEVVKDVGSFVGAGSVMHEYTVVDSGVLTINVDDLSDPDQMASLYFPDLPSPDWPPNPPAGVATGNLEGYFYRIIRFRFG